MSIIDLFDKISDSYYDNDYINALKLIEDYFKLKDVLIFDNILHIYIECQLRLGLFDKASKNIDLMDKLFPGYYSNFDLALKYSRCVNRDKMLELLDKSNFSSDEYYQIACSCFFNNLLDDAKMLFSRYLLISSNVARREQAIKYLKQIRMYDEKRKIFVEMKYACFKYMGKVLEPGHVIYADRVRDEYKENRDNSDPKICRRPYMIWKVVDNKIYVFPLSTKVKKGENKSVLRKENYCAIGFDRVVKNEMVCLEERDIIDVVDKVHAKDYNRVIKNIYYSVCLNHDVPKKSTKLFMDTMVRELEIEVNDVISVPDFLHGQKKYYFILDYDGKKQKYKVIEVLDKGNDRYDVIGNEVITISNKASILNVKKLNVESKNKLVEKIPANFKKVNMLGKIIDYNNKKLEILIEDKDGYVCIDRTMGYYSSFISVEIVRKDIPLTIIGSLSRDDYEKHLYTLKYYITQNSNEFHQKKKLFNSCRKYMKGRI